MLALSLAMALAAFETGAFFAGAFAATLATGLDALAGVATFATFLGVAAALGAVFFAVAIELCVLVVC